MPLDERKDLALPEALLPKGLTSRIHSNTPSLARYFLHLCAEISARKSVVILLLRSGSLAAGVFYGAQCTDHRVCQRYTVRKGQGKAQSSQDSKRRAKSMGSQLRRAGEESLKDDIRSTILDWENHLDQACLILVSCPKAMRGALFSTKVEGILARTDPRLRRIPIDVGRPNFEGVKIVHQVVYLAQVIF